MLRTADEDFKLVRGVATVLAHFKTLFASHQFPSHHTSLSGSNCLSESVQDHWPSSKGQAPQTSLASEFFRLRWTTRWVWGNAVHWNFWNVYEKKPLMVIAVSKNCFWRHHHHQRFLLRDTASTKMLLTKQSLSPNKCRSMPCQHKSHFEILDPRPFCFPSSNKWVLISKLTSYHRLQACPNCLLRPFTAIGRKTSN